MERMLVAAATPVLTNIGLAKLPDGCEVFHFSHINTNTTIIILSKFSVIMMGDFCASSPYNL